MAKIPLAVQLYTVRDLTKDDFVGTVRKIAELGYGGVELAGFGNLTSAKEVTKALADAGLKLAGNHVGIDRLETSIAQVLDENDALGNKNILVPWMPEERRKDAAGWKAVGQLFNRVAAECHKRGFEFGYHNHSFEFQKFNGKTGLDILWENSDPKLVKSELDTYWVKHGGEDPVSYIRKLGKRILTLHLKDMAAGPEQRFAEVGTGILDFKNIIEAGQKAGAKWYIVEQDSTYDRPPLESLRTSFGNLKKLGFA
jgi:sugar phosphate isomerase/epimerase